MSQLQLFFSDSGTRRCLLQLLLLVRKRCAMDWSRSPLHAPVRSSSPTDDKSERNDEDDWEDSVWTPTSTQFPISVHPQGESIKPPFQPTCMYNEYEEAHILEVDRHATRVRNCLCCGLSVFCAVFVLVGFGVVLAGSPSAQAHARTLMHRIEQSPMVQFKITPKPHVVLEKYGKRHEETTDFHGFTGIRGQLFPFKSDDQERLSFNGWIQIETNISTRYDMVLTNHRGYRIMRTVPLIHRRSRCVTSNDIPPLHYLSTAAERAFQAQDWASFRMNCSRPRQAPVEIVFAHTPFVFCPDDLVSRTFSPVANSTAFQAQTSTLWIHGEKMLIELVFITNKEDATQARLERARLDDPEMWGNGSSGLIDNCPYLEAPLTSYTPRSSGLLDDLLGNASVQGSRPSAV